MNDKKLGLVPIVVASSLLKYIRHKPFAVCVAGVGSVFENAIFRGILIYYISLIMSRGAVVIAIGY